MGPIISREILTNFLIVQLDGERAVVDRLVGHLRDQMQEFHRAGQDVAKLKAVAANF